MGGVATSVGLFAALAVLVAIRDLPAHLPAFALSTAVGAFVAVGAVAWAWRAYAAGRFSSLLPASPAGRTKGAARPVGHVPGAVASRIPAGIEREALLAELRAHFLQLQEAWDTAAAPSLQALTTPEMLAELRLGLPACMGDSAPTRTDILTLRADLFCFEELGEALLVSVEFSGLMREAPGERAAPFRELWMLTKPRVGESGWKLARHQTLL
jgi:predicted lipid-binding transport protein (Tim44 family)